MSRNTTRTIERRYRDGETLTMLTAYDAPTARLVDRSGVDMILVGDSAGDNHLGYQETMPVTMAEALSNTGAVVRGSENALIVADLPFMSYGTSVETSVENAGRLVKEEDADAVKLETPPHGGITVDVVDRCTDLGIPVQGHLGLTPQHAKELGGPVVHGRDGPDTELADDLVATARDLESAGIFSLVLECVTEGVARRITDAVDVPTIGIGAGRFTDGQVLVTNDVIGLDAADSTLSKQYGEVDTVIENACDEFVSEVESGEFPTADHAYEPVDD